MTHMVISSLELVPPLLDVFKRNLSLESTLRELALHDFQVESSCSAEEVIWMFESNPLLPGVVLMKEEKFFGMISRRRFRENMSRPYGLDLFRKRPLLSLYEFTHKEPLILPGDISVVGAAQRSLERRPDFLYEPIVVELEAEAYRLLDVHQLLVAQSQILEQARLLLEEANQELARLASQDGLTQVANRRSFDKYLDKEWQRLARERSPLSLILCDVDCFKAYNDSYGHQMGDDCLQRVAEAIRETVTRPGDLVSRYGGEEFAVILPNTPTTGAMQIAEEIRSAVKGLGMRHKKSVVCPYVTLSLGVASVLPSYGDSASPILLIAAADKALYRAKDHGRDRVMLNSTFNE